MKQNIIRVETRPRVARLLVCLIFVLCVIRGCLSVKEETKKLDIVQDKAPKPAQAPAVGKSQNKKLDVNLPLKGDVPPAECPEKDKECEKDKLGYDAIRMLHLLIDDDHNGNVDQSESDEFLRDELQYTDGFERHSLFHNSDKLISVDDLWKAWKYSAVYNWTVDDVIEWLVQDVDLPQYSHVFHNLAIDGTILPRLVNSTGPMLASLGIRNPVHKQKLSLKAMDTVLFGAPKKIHSYIKDITLFMAILLAIGISWFACLHHRYSQTQVKKMMKDLESLQKAEDALKKLSKELADAEKNQISMPHDKQEELRMLRRNSMRLKVTRVNSGDKSPKSLSREGSVYRRQEGEMKLKQAEEELASLREALSEAETRLEIQQQLETQWSVPGELQAWLQLTHELEQVHYNAKRQAAERQLLAARDGCDKIKKRNKAFFGSLRMAHSNSLDDIDQSILDARVALEEVKQDLQERLHRWHTIELLCGFPVISNPGLNALKQALGRDTGNAPRLPGSLLAPISIDEADEDLPPTAFLSTLYSTSTTSARPRASSAGYSGTSLPSTNKSSTFLKQQTLTGSTGSLPHMGKVPSTGSTGTGHARKGSRDDELHALSTGCASASGTMGSTSSSVVFQLGDNAQHERTTSTTSLSPVSTSPANGHHPGHPSSHHGQPRSGYNQSMSYPPYSFNTTSTPVISSNLSKNGSSGNLLSNNTLPRGAGNSSSKIYSSPIGNHMSSRSTSVSSKQSPTDSDSTDAKMLLNDSGDVINNNISGASRGGSSVSPVTIPHAVSMYITSHQQPHNQNNHLEDSDGASLNSVPRSQSHSALSRNQLLRSQEFDCSSVESLQQSSRGLPAKKSKKMKFLPNFLTKNKGKQKTT